MVEEKRQDVSQGQETQNQVSLKELEEKSKLVDEYLEQLQRVQAEFENYRKRVVKEKEEFRKYALEELLYELLGILDNIQRALDSASKNHSYESLVEGIHIVERQFLELLKVYKVVPLKVNVGDKFDPKLHHAVSHESCEQYPDETIINVLAHGYSMADRVLRPAMVVVSSGPDKGGKE